MSDFSVDDPMLALIARFAACCTDKAVSEDAFLRQQCDQIRVYVENAPEDLRQERALEWIMRNAEDYRRKWHQHVVTQEAPTSRCPDCPLKTRSSETTCEIHERWLSLLTEYLAGTISSKTYVLDTLNLLAGYKERLIARAPQSGPPG
jgi:hypothetical protein